MALKDLLVCIDPTTGSDTRLKLSFNLARTNKAHLAGAYSLPDAQAAFGGATRFGGFPGMSGVAEEPMSPGSAVSEAFHEAEVADRAEYRFKNELRLAGIDGEWHTVPDGDSAELIELAKSVDLTIMGQRPPSAGSDRAARFRPEDVVIATGRPVLVVPYAGIACRSMWLKAKLETCRRESEADTEAHVVDAARPSTQALTETGLVTKRASGHCGDA
jgi:hypothetical protein